MGAAVRTVLCVEERTDDWPVAALMGFARWRSPAELLKRPL